MLRARLLTAVVFNAVLALWVWHDARRRGAAKPVFAAVLALFWGPLGLGLWESDRPLRGGERRHGTGRAIAAGFLRAWAALLPAVCVLAWHAVADRAAVPGSLGRQVGLLPATAAAVSLLWGGPALLAGLLGWLGRAGAREQGSPLVPGASVPSSMAVAAAGGAALVVAVAMAG